MKNSRTHTYTIITILILIILILTSIIFYFYIKNSFSYKNPSGSDSANANISTKKATDKNNVKNECQPNTSNNTKKSDTKSTTESPNNTTEIKDTTFPLTKFLPNLEGKVLNYSGTAEFMETITVNKVLKSSGKTNIILKGALNNMSEKGNQNSTVEYNYEISNNDIKVFTKNSPIYHWQPIASSQTLIKGPIKVGNSWCENLIIDKKTYTATSTIVNVFKDSDNKTLIKIETIINNIPNYPSNTYKETRVFKEDMGLYSYEKTILLKSDNNSGPTPLDFNLHLVENQ
ncbi:hypothetical protein C3495_12895 [Clostridiaceae bacterium 14S0207]|nr:hypothetical protein C3495_12895 [Clostridiaceae bacterium 14S0207]